MTAGEACDPKSGCRQVRIFEARSYPVETSFAFVVSSIDPQKPGTLTNASAPFLEQHAQADLSSWNVGYQSQRTDLPVPLDYGSAYQAARLTISSYEQCKAFAGTPDASGPVSFDNRLVVHWSEGQAQCTARIVCFP